MKSWLWGSYRSIIVVVEVWLARVLPPAMMVTSDQLNFFRNAIFLPTSWPFLEHRDLTAASDVHRMSR